MGWIFQSNYIMSDNYPHETVDSVPKQELFAKYKGALFIRYTTDFDCEETQFWYCIKDDEFDINQIKAKRRYEINKGLKNFRTEIIDPVEYSEDIYNVYCKSLEGYEKGAVAATPKEAFIKGLIENSQINKEYLNFFGVFEIETGKLCGYSDVYKRGRYIPISSLKTIPEYEKSGVNFSLIYGIIQYFGEDIKNGSYLCDGARNIIHQTNFQDFLIKYFEFRRAYCKLHIEYRKPYGCVIKALFPFRKLLKKIKINKVKTICALFRQEAWKRGLAE